MAAIREKERLPDDRTGVIHRFRITDKYGKITAGHIQSGLHPDGRLGEVFIKAGKPGGETAWMDQWAILASVALQHGAPVAPLFSKFVGSNFEPSGYTTNKEIPRCTSVLDYIARWILLKYSDQNHE